MILFYASLQDCAKKLYEVEKNITNLKMLDFIEDLPGEIWKDIEGYEGLYQISNKGRVKSFKIGCWRVLKTNNNCAYYVVKLFNQQKTKRFLVHRLVATAFIPNPKNVHVVSYIDGNKLNNCVENLEWVTHSENIEHAFRIGLKKVYLGTKNSNVKLTAEQVKEIRKTYKPRDKNLGKSLWLKNLMLVNLLFKMSLIEKFTKM